MSTQATAATRPGQQLSQAAVTLLRQFPPRPPEWAWETTGQSRDAVLRRLLAPPFVLEAESSQSKRRVGLRKVLAWLEQYPGQTWQERWVSSGADAAGNLGWRQLAMRWLQSTGWAYQTPKNDFHALGAGLLPLISGEVIRPSLDWLLTPGTVQKLTAELARSRDPQGFAALAALSRDDPANYHTKDVALTRIATMMAAKGGMVSDITVGDCLEMASGVAAIPTADTSVYFYQMLHAMGTFPEAAPPTVRFFEIRGQISIEQMIDRYQIACRPVRDLLVDYLRERSPSIDYASLRGLAYALGKRFWKDLENHHTGIDSLHLAPGVATAWKQRVGQKKTRTVTGDGTIVETETARADLGLNCLSVVRSFYLDLAAWAMEDPAQWGVWAAPCPIREEEMSRRKEISGRKSRIDQRTRERLPVLPVLTRTVDAERRMAAERLQAAHAASPGAEFTAGGRTWRKTVTKNPASQSLGARPGHAGPPRPHP